MNKRIEESSFHQETVSMISQHIHYQYEIWTSYYPEIGTQQRISVLNNHI